MTNLTNLFDNLDNWRHLPAYQLERRADIFFSIYLPELLEERYGFEIEGLVPEFPLRIGTIYPEADMNRSPKVDYLAKARGSNVVVLVEPEIATANQSDTWDTFGHIWPPQLSLRHRTNSQRYWIFGSSTHVWRYSLGHNIRRNSFGGFIAHG